MVAVHLGVVDEEAINNMSIVFFEDVLEHLGQKLRYDAVVNYAGNSFCEKSWEMIMDQYPLIDHSKDSRELTGIAKMIASAPIRVMKPGEALPGSLGKIKEGNNENG